MPAVETCIILKWDSGVQVEQDLSLYYDAVASEFFTQTWVNKDGGSLVLKIPAELQGDGSTEPAFVIDALQEVWVGIRDGSTWTSVRFGGYVGPYTVQKVGGDHVYTISLFTYSRSFETVSVTSWPMDITQTIPNNAASTYPGRLLSGYPPMYGDTDPDHQYTAGDYLIGTIDPGGFPYNGVIVEYLPGVDVELGFGTAMSVPAAFRELHFTFGNKPRLNTIINGFFKAATLGEVVDEILRVAAYLAQDLYNLGTMGYAPIRPVYWLKAVIDTTDSTRIRPKFMLRDLNDLSGVDMVFTDLAVKAEGQYDFWDLVITTDPTETRTVVEVFGLGTRAESIDIPPLEPGVQLIYEFNANTVENYPAPYHKPRPGATFGGWEGAPVIEPKIETYDQVKILTNTVTNAVYMPKVTANFKCDVPVEEGLLITIRSTSPYFNQTLPVTQVRQQGTPGRTVYDVTAGWVKPTLSEIMSGDTVDLITLRHQGPADTFTYYSSGMSIPETSNSGLSSLEANSSQRNLYQPERDNVVGAHYYTAQNRKKALSNGLYVDPDALYPPSLAGTSDVPVPQPLTLPAVAPAPAAVAWNSTGIPKAWLDAENNVHPVETAKDFYSDGWQPVTLVAPAALTTAIFQVEYDEDANVVSDFVNGGFTGMTLTLKRTVFQAFTIDGTTIPAGTVTTVSGSAVTNTAPLIVDYGMALTVHVTGLADGHMVKVFLSEREPDPSLFKGGNASDTP
jgi:hypothetical protein